MLARTRLTAQELGIDQKTYDALTLVRNMVADGRIQVGPAVHRGNFYLDMGTVICDTNCGTVGCFGGWAALLMEMDDKQTDAFMRHAGESYHSPLFGLFWEYPKASHNITTEQAVAALDAFFAGHKKPWQVCLD